MATQAARPLKTHFEESDESQIRRLSDSFVQAIRARDIAAILSFYADDAVICDVRDTLRIDKAGLRKSWEECFEGSKEFNIELRDVQTRVDGNIAFSFGLTHATGKTINDDEIDVWMRFTTCLNKVNGKWLAVHDHVSVPGDFMTGKVLQDLKP